MNQPTGQAPQQSGASILTADTLGVLGRDAWWRYEDWYAAAFALVGAGPTPTSSGSVAWSGTPGSLRVMDQPVSTTNLVDSLFGGIFNLLTGG